MPRAWPERRYTVGEGDPDLPPNPVPMRAASPRTAPEPHRGRGTLSLAGQTRRAIGKEPGSWLGEVKAVDLSHGFFFFPPSLHLPPLLQSVARELSAMLFQFRGSCNRKDQLLENPWKALGESHGRKVISRQSYYHYAAN